MAQKITSVFMILVIFLQIGLTYSLANTYTIFEQPKDYPTTDMIENPEKYYEMENENTFVVYNNFKYGYQLALPKSYGAYMKDGSFRLSQNLFGNEDIDTFGPAFGSDNAMINIEVLDQKSISEKSNEENWVEDYINKKWGLLPNEYDSQEYSKNDFFPINALSGKATSVTLKKEIQGKNDLLFIEVYDRLYIFLYEKENSVHQSILFQSGAFSFQIPQKEKEEFEWQTLDIESCPFIINLPHYWLAFDETEELQEGFFGDTPYREPLNWGKIQNCELDGFMAIDDSALPIYFDYIQIESLEDYLHSKNYYVIQEGVTTWQNLPAKRLLLGMGSKDENLDTNTLEYNYRGVAFAIQLKENEWIILRYDSYGGILYEPEEQLERKILNSIVIK